MGGDHLSQVIKRVFYVASLRSTVIHIMFGRFHSEGLTACRRVVTKGWYWSKARTRRAKVCSQCLAAAEK